MGFLGAALWPATATPTVNTIATSMGVAEAIEGPALCDVPMLATD